MMRTGDGPGDGPGDDTKKDGLAGMMESHIHCPGSRP